MKPDFKKCCIFLALLAAAAVLIVLFIKWNEADVSITIGFPVEAGAVDYTNSKPISDRRTVNRILFALLTGKSLDDSAVPNVPPDAVMMIRPKEENIGYPFSIWLDQTSVIYAMGTGDDAAEYRIVSISDEEYRVFNSIIAARG